MKEMCLWSCYKCVFMKLGKYEVVGVFLGVFFFLVLFNFVL